jgi:hypothetical protein
MRTYRGARRFGWFLAALLATAGSALGQPCRSPDCVQDFPKDAGSINVRDFGAKGDGHTDDTAAILAAIAESGGDTGRQMWHDRLVYLPPGTYLVSGTLLKRYADGHFASGMILVGHSVERTTIRLADHASGYSDPTRPRPVVMTTSKRVDKGGSDYEGKGEGNDAYENFVENLTIDVGANNPGAVGIDYLANNIGAVRDVLLHAGPGSGAAGIVMLRKWPGPALLQRVTVEGFDVGIDIGNTEYGITLSRVLLSGQRVAGLRNVGNSVTTEYLNVEGGAGPALINRTTGGLIVLSEASLSTRVGNTLQNEGTLVFRDVAVHGGDLPAAMGPPDRRVSGWLSGPTQWHPLASSWTLPHPEAPAVATGAVGAWAHVKPPPEDDAQREDATDGLKAALRSGASTVYLPHGTYWISDGLEIPASVHRILGMNSTIRVLPQRLPAFTRKSGMLRVREPGQPLAIERLAFDNTNAGQQVGVEVSGDRTVLLKDTVGSGVTTLDRQPSGGTTFLEDTCCGLIRVAGPRPVVARQLNSEGGGVRVTNTGTPLAIIGIKTEGFCTAVETEASGRTEVIGGLIYIVAEPSGPDMPAFVTKDAEITATFVEEALLPSRHYKLYLSEQQSGSIRETSSASMPSRGLGHIVPLLQGRTSH